jgi:hypothetical protein
MTKQEIMIEGTKDYCSPLYSMQEYAAGNAPFNDVEASINSALDFYAEQESIAFAEWVYENRWRAIFKTTDGTLVWDHKDEKTGCMTGYVYKEYLKSKTQTKP